MISGIHRHVTRIFWNTPGIFVTHSDWLRGTIGSTLVRYELVLESLLSMVKCRKMYIQQLRKLDFFLWLVSTTHHHHDSWIVFDGTSPKKWMITRGTPMTSDTYTSNIFVFLNGIWCDLRIKDVDFMWSHHYFHHQSKQQCFFFFNIWRFEQQTPGFAIRQMMFRQLQMYSKRILLSNHQ